MGHPIRSESDLEYALLQDVEGEHAEQEEFEVGEVVIHQVIETIEFVLGTVSHTASYLRIWALSLSHQQLSLVFYENTMTNGLTMDFPFNMFALYFLFAIWFWITVCSFSWTCWNVSCIPSGCIGLSSRASFTWLMDIPSSHTTLGVFSCPQRGCD